MFRMRPSAAFVVACLALVVALGSTAQADRQAQTAGRPGRPIHGAKFVQVRSAAASHTVVSASTMTVQKVARSVPVPASGNTSKTLFDLAGLKLVYGCASGTENESLTASVSELGQLELVIMNDSANPPVGQFSFQNADYRPIDGKKNLLKGDPNREDGFGHLIWQTESGKLLVFDFAMEGNAFGFPGGHDNCTIGGTVTSG